MKKTYCYVGDLLGFRKTILNLNEEEQIKRVEEWVQFIESGKDNFNHITDYHWVSDTIFVGASDCVEGLDDLILFSKYVLEEGAKKSFLMRGAIAFGNVRWNDKITFGKAIVNAYVRANNQEWIGTSCESDLPHINSLWNFDKVFCYPPPMKRGEPIRLSPVVSWKVPPTDLLSRLSTDKGLTSTGEGLRWEWGMKIQNTRIFALYLEKIKSLEERDKPHKANPSEFHGSLHTSLIEINIEDLHLGKDGIYKRT
jgi:hypothetical protein